MNDAKPGLKTSEFWALILVAIIPYIERYGVKVDLDADTANAAMVQGAQIIGSALAFVAYVWSRVKIKGAA